MEYLTEFILSLLIFGLFMGMFYILHVTGERRFTAQNIQEVSFHIIGKIMIPHIVFHFVLPRLMDSFFDISDSKVRSMEADKYYLKNIAANGFLTLWIAIAGIIAIIINRQQ
jgi:hypothetical protein